MFLKKSERVFRVWRLQINGHLWLTGIALGKERAPHIIEMINLIHAGFDCLKRVHAFWDMTGYRHAQPMSFSRNCFQSLQLDVISNFDLFETGILIMLDRGARFFSRIDLNIE